MRKHELSKLRILAYLADPARTASGATLTELEREAAPERQVHIERLIATMADAGLIDRGLDASDARAKPYSITGSGTAYLESARHTAMFPENSPRQDWSSSALAPELHEAVSGILRDLPEFRHSDDQRIQAVSEQLAAAMTQRIARVR